MEQQIHWYPGHMAKAKKAILRDVKLVDIVIELLDARIPHSSKNGDIDQWTTKPKIVVFNKIDMADPDATAIWKAHVEQLHPVILLNSKGGSGFKEITATADKIMQEKRARLRERGRIFKPIRAMIVGIPNVGKSTFINSYVKKSIAKAENKPGVTRSNQWIKINKSFELLDTPGMLPPKIENHNVGINLALTGAIGYNMDNYVLSVKLLEILAKKYPNLLSQRYNLGNTTEPSEALLENIAKNRSFILKGGKIDINRCANMLLEELRNNKMGRLTLELPEEVWSY